MQKGVQSVVFSTGGVSRGTVKIDTLQSLFLYCLVFTRFLWHLCCTSGLGLVRLDIFMDDDCWELQAEKIKIKKAFGHHF